MAKKKPPGSNSQQKKGKRRFISLSIIIISALVIIYFFGSYHFIQTNKKMYVVRKLQFGFQDTYVDMRKWSVLDMFYHPELEQAIIKDGGQKLLKQFEQTFSRVDE